MSKWGYVWRIVFSTAFLFAANAYALTVSHPVAWAPIGVVLVLVNLLAGFTDLTVKRFRLKVCNHGRECLLIVCEAALPSVIWHLAAPFWLSWDWGTWLWSALVCVLAHVILFWNGILCVYLTSVQLGIRYRVIGALCGMIPIVNVFVLRKILKVVGDEIRLETAKDVCNRERHSLQVCKTRYPILFVHGVFFRDSSILNYWGRIPAELEKNGATVFYGHHSSALSVCDSAKELAWRIRTIVDVTGCEKVNIIAHSKGGLDCRCAMANEGVAPLVASLTTVNSPHRGCDFADYLLEKIPAATQKQVSAAYNKAAHALGDERPDFMAAVQDLTAKACQATDREWTVPEGVFCQSFGSVLSGAGGGRFPLNFSYSLVKYFDGPNDGLVATDSFAFGERYRLIHTEGKRGISHADMIDLNRENIEGFDVREFYVELVQDLKARGL